jgi:hypothetical protein
VTALLRAWSDGDECAADALMPLVYGELRRLARLYMSRERQGLTLQPTALVHEAYLRLVDIRRVRARVRSSSCGSLVDWMSRKRLKRSTSQPGP